MKHRLSQPPANCEFSQSELWSAMQSLVRRGLVEKRSESGRGMFILNAVFKQYIYVKFND
jgi:predicted transcriptional regulator